MSSFMLKLIGIISMIIDHVGFIIYPQYKILRYIGRIAFVIFAYQIGVGFSHTKSKEKYILRMIIFSIISQYPFYLALKAGNPSTSFELNVGATFTFALLALYCIEKIDNKILKYITVLVIIALSCYVPMDYGVYGILTVIIFYLFKDSKILMSACYSLLLLSYCSIKNSTFNLPAIFALIPICFHNGKKGPNMKYLFYIFYPIHFLVILYIKSKLFIT